MANRDEPTGAMPYGDVLRCQQYVAGAACYPGDFVNMQSDGMVDPADATETLLGVAATYASGAGANVMVYDHPDQMFIVQADGSDIDTQTDIGLNYNILSTAANTTYRISRMELDSDTGLASVATLPLRLLGIEPKVGNALGAQVDCIVQINAHDLGGTLAGV